MLEVRLLGQFNICLDGKPVEIRSRPTQLLFAYLLLHVGIPHRREKLAGLLWPDSTEHNARSNIRQALWRLKKAIGTDDDPPREYILADHFTIAFNPDSEYWLDTSELEGDESKDTTTDHLAQSLSIYNGELLPGFYEDWVQAERERFQTIYERRLQIFLERLLAERRWHQTLEWGNRWIALSGAPEPAFRALMLAYSGLGDLSSLATVFQRCSEALRENVGVELSEETQTLYDQLSQGMKPSDILPDVAMLSHAPSRETPPYLAMYSPSFLEDASEGVEVEHKVFVERQNEQILLNSFLEKSLAGNGQVVFITGEAGSGKTALAQEFARHAHENYADLIVAFGQCNALTGIGDPYHPFRNVLGMLTSDVEAMVETGTITYQQAVRQWSVLPLSLQILLEEGADLVDSFIQGSGLISRAAAHGPDCAEWIPHLEHQLKSRSARYVESDLEQRSLFDQYVKVLLSISQTHPLLLVLDDLQWADLGSISLLFNLGRQIEGSRILLIGIYRRDEVLIVRNGDRHPLAKILAEFKQLFGDIQIDLEEVEEAENRNFVDAFLDTEPNRLDGEFRDALYRQTRGHPLFTIELLRAMEARGDLVHDDERRWVKSPSLDWGKLPAKVEGVIEERTGKLDEALHEMLTVASVEGETFTAEVIAQVLAIDELETVRRLSRDLEKKHRIVIAQGTRWLGQQRISIYRFRHNLFQKHLYNRLNSVERSYLHETVGKTLEALYGEQRNEIAIQLAHHFSQAGIAEKAIDYLQEAGDEAKRISANVESINHFTNGLDLIQKIAKGSKRNQKELELQLSMGVALIAAKGYADQDVESAFTRAHKLCHQIGETSKSFSAILGLWSYYTVRARHKTALELAEELLEMAQGADEPALLLEAHRALGTTCFYLGEVERSRALIEQGLAIYDPEAHREHKYLYGEDPGVSCLIHLALALFFLGYPDQALERTQDAIALAEDTSHPYTMAYALNMAAMFHSSRHETQLAQTRAEAALSISLEHGFPIWLTVGKILQGWALAEGGLDEGLDQIHQGLASWQELGAEQGRSFFLSLYAEALEKNGRIEEGLHVISEALDAVQKNDERFNESELYRLKGEFLLAHDKDHAEAEANLQKALQISRRRSAKSLELRATISLFRLWQKQDMTEKARKTLEKIFQWFTEGASMRDLIVAQELLEGI
jgi:predicted ATPase/DNA-binding SARP family transcriptional activator